MSLSLTEFPSSAEITYDAARKQLQNGDVLICSGSGIFSAMIQQATESIWSHVGFILRLEEIDRVMLLESVEPIGVRTIRLSKYLTGYDEKRKKPYNGGLAIIRHKKFETLVDQSKLKQLAQYAVECFGHPYDKDEIAKIAARIMSSRVPFTAKQMRKIKPDSEFICSEYVARCYEAIGIEVQWNNLGFIAPSDFAADPNFELVGVLKKK
jgi:hypothetical protein